MKECSKSFPKYCKIPGFSMINDTFALEVKYSQRSTSFSPNLIRPNRDIFCKANDIRNVSFTFDQHYLMALYFDTLMVEQTSLIKEYGHTVSSHVLIRSLIHWNGAISYLCSWTIQDKHLSIDYHFYYSYPVHFRQIPTNSDGKCWLCSFPTKCHYQCEKPFASHYNDN